MSKETYEKESGRINELYVNNEENDESMNKYMGTKNELSEAKEIPKLFEIESNFTWASAGKVMNRSVEGKFVLLADTTSGVLNLDNIIFDSNKIPVGYLDDVVGKIDNPFYIIKFLPTYTGNTDLTGSVMSYVKEKAKYVNKQELVRQKGCDASNAFDEEVDLDEEDVSDDDQEAVKKVRKFNKKQNNPNKQSNPISQNNPNSQHHHDIKHKKQER